MERAECVAPNWPEGGTYGPLMGRWRPSFPAGGHIARRRALWLVMTAGGPYVPLLGRFWALWPFCPLGSRFWAAWWANTSDSEHLKYRFLTNALYTSRGGAAHGVFACLCSWAVASIVFKLGGLSQPGFQAGGFLNRFLTEKMRPRI